MKELRAYYYAGMREQDERGRLTTAVRVAVRERNLAIVKNLKESGIDINIIMQATGLTEKRLTIYNTKSTTTHIIKTSIKIE